MTWGWLSRLAAGAAESGAPPGATPPTGPMSGPPNLREPLRAVTHGGPVEGVCWTTLAGPDPHHAGELLTFVARERAGHQARSGMGGPKLPAGRLVNTWHGTATGLPPFVLLRA